MDGISGKMCGQKTDCKISGWIPDIWLLLTVKLDIQLAGYLVNRNSTGRKFGRILNMISSGTPHKAGYPVHLYIFYHSKRRDFLNITFFIKYE